ncbi:MAG: NAD(P)H-hydrate dehydratase [Caldimonas sp.]
MSEIGLIDSGIGRLALHGVASTRTREAAALAAVAPFTLMGRAGECVARLALAITPHARKVLVFAGPGNNGGDGLEAATRLREFGKETSVILVGEASRLPSDAARALERARSAGVDIRAFDPGASDDADGFGSPDLVIDALIGIGLSRPPEGPMAAAIQAIARLATRGARVLAVDVPSGFDADRGRPVGQTCVTAGDTLTFLTAKPGLFTGSGRDHAGRIWMSALDTDVVVDRSADAFLVGRADPSCAAVPRRPSQHKGSFGDVAIVGGAPGMTGAAWLAARAAQAAGAGRVFVDLLGADAAGLAAVDPRHPELMFRAGWAHGDATDVSRATVVCGCGGGDAVRAVLPRLLSIVGRLVLDADALNAIAGDATLQTLLKARASRGHQTILTPHPLEAARLLGTDTAGIQADRVRCAGELAERHGAVVVLKGSGTVIARAGEPPRINATGNASLASAGTGDVLAGWIGGRWAAGAGAAFDVATRAVIEHGAAAEPERAGSLRASDLIEALYANAGRG